MSVKSGLRAVFQPINCVLGAGRALPPGTGARPRHSAPGRCTESSAHALRRGWVLVCKRPCSRGLIRVNSRRLPAKRASHRQRIVGFREAGMRTGWKTPVTSIYTHGTPSVVISKSSGLQLHRCLLLITGTVRAILRASAQLREPSSLQPVRSSDPPLRMRMSVLSLRRWCSNGEFCRFVLSLCVAARREGCRT
jgi:hypothetical protein